MISQKQRIGRQKILDLQRKKPICINGQFFSVKFWPNEKGVKIAILVSKKVSKLATERNFVKRKTAQFCIKNLKDNGFYIIYPKKEILVSKDIEKEEDFFKIKEELHSLLAR